MSDRSRRGLSRSDEFPRRFKAWLDENEALLAGLVRLRQVPRSEEAVDAVLDVPTVSVFRLSWELWASLTAGVGGDPEAVLLGRVPLSKYEQAQLAIYGKYDDGPPCHLRLVHPN